MRTRAARDGRREVDRRARCESRRREALARHEGVGVELARRGRHRRRDTVEERAIVHAQDLRVVGAARRQGRQRGAHRVERARDGGEALRPLGVAGRAAVLEAARVLDHTKGRSD